MSGTVADTSVWIDFFTGKSESALEDALAAGSVILPPIVLSELVSGARSEGDKVNLTAPFAIWLAATKEAHDEPAQRLRRRLDPQDADYPNANSLVLHLRYGGH